MTRKAPSTWGSWSSGDGELAFPGRDRLHLDLDDVPGPDQRIEVPGLGPLDALVRHPADAVLETDEGLGLRGAQDDGVGDLSGLDGVARPAFQPDGAEVGRPLGEEVLLVPPPAPLLVLGPEPRPQGVLGELLELGIEGRMDLEPGVVEGVGAVVLLEIPADLLEEIGAELGARPAERQDGERPGLGRFRLRPGDDSPPRPSG